MVCMRKILKVAGQNIPNLCFLIATIPLSRGSDDDDEADPHPRRQIRMVVMMVMEVMMMMMMMKLVLTSVGR